MKLKIPKFKVVKLFKSLLSARYIYVLIALLTAAVIWWLGTFLNENFYKTIIQSDEIILLRKEVASQTINIDRFEKVLEALDRKTDPPINLPEWEKVNPFIIIRTSPPVVPSAEE